MTLDVYERDFECLIKRIEVEDSRRRHIELVSCAYVYMCMCEHMYMCVYVCAHHIEAAICC